VKLTMGAIKKRAEQARVLEQARVDEEVFVFYTFSKNDRR